jgi:hypothetical protein
MKNENNPVYEKRIGSVRVAIWENQNSGGVWHNVSIVRHYKDGEEWKEASTYNGLADLALVREAVEVAREWIRRRELGDANTASIS